MKISESYVLLDDVPYSEGSYVNRALLWRTNDFGYATIPVKKSNGQLIKDVEIADKFFLDKILRTIDYSYRRAPHYEELISIMSAPELTYSIKNSSRLIDFNISFYSVVLQKLRFECNFTLASSLVSVGTREERIVKFAQALGKNCLVVGDGSSAKTHQFGAIREGAVRIFLHPFFSQHPTYRQHTSAKFGFRRGLSVLDSVAQIGLQATVALLDRDTLVEQKGSVDGAF